MDLLINNGGDEHVAYIIKVYAFFVFLSLL